MTPVVRLFVKLVGVLGMKSLMQMILFRGYSMNPPTIEEYRDLHELQTVVEPAVAALAAERATQEQL